MATNPAPARRYAAALRRLPHAVPRLCRTVLAAVLVPLALALLSGLAAPAAAVSDAGAPSGSTITAPVAAKAALSKDVYAKRVQRHLNRTRAAHGLAKVKGNACAARFADNWSSHLASTGAFFHQSLGPILSRCDAMWAGENLAKGAVSPKRIVTLWMNSPGHRAIVLSPNAKRVGVGAVVTSQGVWVVTADFVKN